MDASQIIMTPITNLNIVNIEQSNGGQVKHQQIKTIKREIQRLLTVLMQKEGKLKEN
jgi:hypothetical protein